VGDVAAAPLHEVAGETAAVLLVVRAGQVGRQVTELSVEQP
jgi:hypothetical protein